MQRRWSVLALIVAELLVLAGAGQAAQRANPDDPGRPAAQITLTGKVVDSQGRPLEGVKVTLYQMTYSEAIGSPQVESSTEKMTQADGAFVFTAAKDADRYRAGCILVRKEGLALSWATWQMQRDEQRDIALGAGKELGGEVVDENGQPLSNAEVHVALAIIGRMQDQRYLIGWGSFEPLRIKTDSRGRFAFANMPVEATFEFLVKKFGRATLCTLDPTSFRGEKCQFSAGQSAIRIVLPPQATAEGVVVEKAAGKPVAGVKVLASPDPRILPSLNEPATSGADGAFRIEGLGPGGFLVQLSAAGSAAEWVAEPVRIDLKPGEAKRGIKIELAKGSVIEILVRDSTGKPVAKANAGVRPAEGQQFFGGPTNEKGLVRLRVKPGQYAFSGAYKQGYTQSQRTEEQIEVAEGDTKRLECILNPAPKIAGTVRDEAGHPLAGVTIEIKPMGGPPEDKTDAQGKFEVTWDPAAWGEGTTAALVARDEARNLAALVEIDEQTKSCDLTLKPGVVITGTVLNEEGRPLPDADVRLTLRATRWASDLSQGDPAITDANGKFEIKAVPPERQYTVTATADGYGKQDVPIEDLDAKTARRDLGQFKLPVANLSISGIVVDPNDKPIAGANVYAYGSGQPDLFDIRTDQDGRFLIKGVCPGPIQVNANTSTGASLSGDVQAEGGAMDVRIVISDRPSMRGYAPRRPPSLQGKPLPPLKDVGIDLPAEAEGKMLLVCFWDMGQRPSRNCLLQLAAQATQLREKGVTVVAVQATQVEAGMLRQWVEKNKVPFLVGSMTDNSGKMLFAWGAASLPHLILTDKKQTVVAEGFNLSELGQQIEAAAGR